MTQQRKCATYPVAMSGVLDSVVAGERAADPGKLRYLKR